MDVFSQIRHETNGFREKSNEFRYSAVSLYLIISFIFDAIFRKGDNRRKILNLNSKL